MRIIKKHKLKEHFPPSSPVSKPYKEKPVSPSGHINWKPEFIKLYKHILEYYDIIPEYEDECRLGEKSILLYFSDGSENWYLNVTTTAWRRGGYIQLWDYVLSTLDETKGENIIARGNLRDYNHLLDELLKYDIIQDPKKCRCK